MSDQNHPGPIPGEPRDMQEKVEEESVNDATRLSARLIYEVIRRDGEAELTRPLVSLIWSGVAAGLLISLSVLGEAIFRTYLPEADWVFLLENLGYSFGFIAVILGRMQLFTENTISTVLPVVAKWSSDVLRRMVKLWSVVLSANVVGACLAALFMLESGAFSDPMLEMFAELSRHAVMMGAGESFARAIPAGVLVAAIVWMMPSAQGSGIIIITAFTWLIAAGDFTHIIAGAVEMWYLVLRGDLEILRAGLEFFLPVLAGNVLGGTAIFTLLAWGQVKNEVPQGSEIEEQP
ncbi:formate/nitrite transporter family protein [Maritimibacter sp. HL-12]|uniref:formate/nitrite transporter family protein n=1 Tax=Maritimibacter sp. HL-12 TaxID=1162418 RepID=UPI000A1C9CFE|nr:formate/nitrite transporter family protein [Maritimibacter sp. HL-12]